MKKSIDPRIQFLLLIVQSVLVLCAGMGQLILLNVFALFYLVYAGLYQTACKMGAVIAATVALYGYMLLSDQQWVKFLGFLCFLVLRFGPVIIMARVLQEVPTGRLMAAMQSLRLPKNFILTLAVTLRFFPIIKMENDTIQMLARLRGLSYSQPRNWLRPLQVFEYTFVPLMMRTMKIADELTVSAMTKGIDCPDQRTSIYQTRLTSKDLILVAFFIGYMVCIFTFNFLEV